MRQTILGGLLGVALALAALALLPSELRENAASPLGDESALPERPPNAPAPKDSAAAALPARAAPEPSATGPTPGVPDDDEAPSAPLGTHGERIDMLVAAGFAPARAAAIVDSEAQLRREAAEREYEATGTVRALTGSAQLASEAALRVELGDADFERYLASLGRPTAVAVAGVGEQSAAANAGLQAGDVIRAYGGERVFNLRELTELAQRRSIGETVAVTVVRDGVTLELYVNGGPLGLAPAAR